MAAATYYLKDDFVSDTMLSPEFQAPSVAAATTVAYLMATALQRNVRLVPKAGAPPYTLVSAGAAAIALTAVPSGIGSP